MIPAMCRNNLSDWTLGWIFPVCWPTRAIDVPYLVYVVDRRVGGLIKFSLIDCFLAESRSTTHYRPWATMLLSISDTPDYEKRTWSNRDTHWFPVDSPSVLLSSELTSGSFAKWNQKLAVDGWKRSLIRELASHLMMPEWRCGSVNRAAGIRTSGKTAYTYAPNNRRNHRYIFYLVSTFFETMLIQCFFDLCTED